VTLYENFICDVRILDRLDRIPVIEEPPACSLTFDVDQATTYRDANERRDLADAERSHDRVRSQVVRKG